MDGRCSETKVSQSIQSGLIVTWADAVEEASLVSCSKTQLASYNANTKRGKMSGDDEMDN
ncbi:hypothetical protein BPOR_0569g00020 [Botrytis porri]|uniref:Uncharacterized protein n=1 Tax=Botrytis porri TaxID=87229 RepID=A0A4Z1KF36_9HELO|nr:hypothetical protein BPOR_0569g00020 [Botrytis porri]